MLCDDLHGKRIWQRVDTCMKWSESCSVGSDSLCPMDYPVHGILQARILEWVAFPFSRGSSQPRNRTGSPALQEDPLAAKLQGKPKNTGVGSLSLSPGDLPPRNRTRVSCIAGGFFTSWVIREAQIYVYVELIHFAAEQKLTQHCKSTMLQFKLI